MDILGYRLKKAEDRIEVLADREQVAMLRVTMEDRGRELQKQVHEKADKDDVSTLRSDLHELATEVRNLRKSAMGFTVAFVTGSMGVCATLIATTLH